MSSAVLQVAWGPLNQELSILAAPLAGIVHESHPETDSLPWLLGDFGPYAMQMQATAKGPMHFCFGARTCTQAS